MLTDFLRISVLSVASGPRVKLATLLPNFLGRAIVTLNFVRRFRNFIADTVPC